MKLLHRLLFLHAALVTVTACAHDAEATDRWPEKPPVLAIFEKGKPIDVKEAMESATVAFYEQKIRSFKERLKTFHDADAGLHKTIEAWQSALDRRKRYDPLPNGIVCVAMAECSKKIHIAFYALASEAFICTLDAQTYKVIENGGPAMDAAFLPDGPPFRLSE